ncbi:MAG: leucine-rich repeat domain-containing protein, partial [archaeon]|nr:leucine-rich repeat domain-containing protein [archaeon]
KEDIPQNEEAKEEIKEDIPQSEEDKPMQLEIKEDLKEQAKEEDNKNIPQKEENNFDSEDSKNKYVIKDEDRESKKGEISEKKESKELLSYEEEGKELETIKGIEFLNVNSENIQKISLANNNLKSLPEFFKFPNLIYLDLSHNLINKLQDLAPLSNLEILILAHNSISKIGLHLASLKKLKHLDLSFNIFSMKDNSIIRSFKYNPQLMSLVLEGNFEYNYENAKFLCLELLKQIEFLDRIQIVNNKKTNTKINHTYVKAKGKKNESKKIRTMQDYINFKMEDMENNTEEYDKIMQQETQKKKKKEKKDKKDLSSRYYMHVLNYNFK